MLRRLRLRLLARRSHRSARPSRAPQFPSSSRPGPKTTDSGDTNLTVCVNRTPITGEIEAARDKRDIDAFGCGLAHTIAQAPKEARLRHLAQHHDAVHADHVGRQGAGPDAVPRRDLRAPSARRCRKAHRPEREGQASQKDVVLDNLDAVIAEVSGDGEYRFNERQLLYALRPIVMDETGEELKIGNFNTIITDYEAEHGEIPGMYREPRGSIYHPHRGETITLGTLMVEEYERPAWTFNKLVYIEKEGFSEALKDVRWAERHDCTLMSSKGFSTRAARDLIDKLAEHDEPVTIFCVHDADASGTMIYQTFQEETKARGARKIKIINLGLEPWEAIAMGLEVEERGARRTAQAGRRLRARTRGRRGLGGMAADPPRRTERDDDAAVHRMARRQDGRTTTSSSRRPRCWSRSWPSASRTRSAPPSPNASCARPGFEDQVAAAIAAIKKPDGAELREGHRGAVQAGARSRVARPHRRGREQDRRGAQRQDPFLR